MKKHELLKTRFIIVLLVLFSTSGAVFALPWQNSGKNEAVSPPEKEIKVTGKITGTDNEPIIGASVRVEGTTNGTVSDVNGYYSLNVYIGAKLTFSYVGYKSTTVQVSRAGELNQVLQEDSKVMDELVVVGYGVQKKATLSGSIAGVNGKEILKSPAMNVTNSLAGNVAGLVVVGQSGEPGADYSSLYIRGTGSLNDNSPLIVVDGVPNRSLERIDPSTIENISVLKDASAAIYGSQAANGVILVTTKRGKAEKMGITASYSAGWSRPTYLPEVCNSAEYATLVNEVNQYAGKDPVNRI